MKIFAIPLFAGFTTNESSGMSAAAQTAPSLKPAGVMLAAELTHHTRRPSFRQSQFLAGHDGTIRLPEWNEELGAVRIRNISGHGTPDQEINRVPDGLVQLAALEPGNYRIELLANPESGICFSVNISPDATRRVAPGINELRRGIIESSWIHDGRTTPLQELLPTFR